MMRSSSLIHLLKTLPIKSAPTLAATAARVRGVQRVSYRAFSSGENSGNRQKQSQQEKGKDEAGTASNDNIGYTMGAVVVFLFGLSYASVPLYKAFCQMTGFGGTTQKADALKAATVQPVSGSKIIKVYFTSNVHSAMPWTFRPAQNEVKVIPGETALAFYTVRNKTDFPVTGVATYNVHPPKAGLYFNKIQCFCFEEQRLGAKEEIDMPVFFFIDPEFLNDPAMDGVNNITLSYTFFKTGDERIEQHREQLEKEFEATRRAAQEAKLAKAALQAKEAGEEVPTVKEGGK